MHYLYITLAVIAGIYIFKRIERYRAKWPIRLAKKATRLVRNELTLSDLIGIYLLHIVVGGIALSCCVWFFIFYLPNI